MLQVSKPDGFTKNTLWVSHGTTRTGLGPREAKHAEPFTAHQYALCSLPPHLSPGQGGHSGFPQHFHCLRETNLSPWTPNQKINKSNYHVPTTGPISTLIIRTTAEHWDRMIQCHGMDGVDSKRRGRKPGINRERGFSTQAGPALGATVTIFQ